LPHAPALVTIAFIVGVIWSLLVALMCAAEFYGIQTRALFAWKLGWAILAASFLQFLGFGMLSILKMPDTDHPWAAFAAILVVGSLVALYWASWWGRQRDYFIA
jgi:hypothetical protein